MDKYKVKINPRAIRELDHIYEYIANEKLAPENAKEQVDRIKKAILGLETFLQSHQERNEGRYAAKDYHQLLIDNYIVIFRIDEPNKTVYVVTITNEIINNLNIFVEESGDKYTVNKWAENQGFCSDYFTELIARLKLRKRLIVSI